MKDENFLETTNKKFLKEKQQKFELKGWDENPFDFSNLNKEHQAVAKTILNIFKNCNDAEIFKHQVTTQFKLEGETLIDKKTNPLVKIIEENGFNVAIQGHVTEIKNGKLIKYPELSYIADIRHFEKVYRNILENMKEFFKKNPEALK
jgi:hypothetical protein